eukprot:TRINITY_DN28121_c0_g1_i1.p1 TRINITY_DN28121_c0_g1~~TRINITY_DN28121_c0_g1_i1.p1  ORF type:complete len:473 (-),score=68.43 TRINITY_DN28121_c0_g1_i1:261-1679(-)
MGLEGLGPKASLDDSAYTDGAAFKAGASGKPPPGDLPGFDSALLSNPAAMLGRWVRSPSKFVGWDEYMHFFGMTGDKALQETEEPQEHVILGFSKEKLHILHRLPWRDGLDTEYVVPIDGSVQPVPPAMVANASSSWKVNELMTWVHTWDAGDDGNPLHIGLRTDQKMKIGGTDYTLRYWRNLIRPNEIRVNVEVTYAATGKVAIHTQRYFHKIDVDRAYSIVSMPRPSDLGGCIFPATLSCWTHDGRAVRLAMLPHGSNMPDDWESLPAAKRWSLAEPFPSAGRTSGPFLERVRAEAAAQKIWVCCGLVVRAPGSEQALLQSVALVGADGWLHGMHSAAEVQPDGPYAAGTGEWPATQRARPFGVYDTEVGRIAVVAAPPSAETVDKLKGMGAELILNPMKRGATETRVAVTVLESPPHDFYTKYEVCGPEALPKTIVGKEWMPVLLQPDSSNHLQVSGAPATPGATNGYH